jgi:diguanylate cyclase (GGDEF)-like protein
VSTQPSHGFSRILLVGTAAFHRDARWTQLASHGFTCVAVDKKHFSLDSDLLADAHAVIYQAGGTQSSTMAVLDAMTTRQSALCLILAGPDAKTDTVAQYLRRGAFDYIKWPCSHSRLLDSVTSGLHNRQAFLEVRNLSGDLASANTALAHERDALRQCNQRLAGLNQLTQALARSLEPDAVVEALFSGVPSLIGAELIGLVRTNPEQVWTWSKDRDRDQEQRLRAQLLGRLGRSTQRTTSSATTLRLITARIAHVMSAEDAMLSQTRTEKHAAHDIPLAIGPHGLGVLHVQRDAARPFTEDEQQLLATIGTSLSLTLRNADAHQDLQEMALRDALTGVLNRRALDEPLKRELKSGLRYGTPACLMILDIDYFKTVNDRLGHTAGDLVLQELATVMTDTVRDIDMVGRYGGEEFAIILPHTSVEQAHSLAERLRNLIECHAFAIEDGTVRLTASIGIADVCNPAIASVEDWVNAADMALYDAKAQGRNRVVVHTPVPLAPAQAAALCIAA